MENAEKKTEAKSTGKVKPKFAFQGDKNTKLSVQIKQKTSDLIDDYRKFHREVSGEEVSLDTLISAIITAGITSDRTFVKWRKEAFTAAQNAEPEQKFGAKTTTTETKSARPEVNNSLENNISRKPLFAA